MQEYQWVECLASVSVTAGKPDTILASPKFMRAYAASLAESRALMDFDLNFKLFDSPRFKRGAYNRKRKRFVRKAVKRALKELN